jgi:hypothetical protein
MIFRGKVGPIEVVDRRGLGGYCLVAGALLRICVYV